LLFSDDDDLKADPIVNLNVKFKNRDINEFHNFLNEARLSSLAISIYFATILKLSEDLGRDTLKILVLDDLLISLDMNNRLSLVNILTEKFSNFQIFFFTHDKAFFEVFKSKTSKNSWKYIEMYLDKNEDGIAKPKIKISLNYMESAEKYLKEFDYPACANYLRKEVERIKKIKEKQEKGSIDEIKIFNKFKKMVLDSYFENYDNNIFGKIFGKLKGFKSGLIDTNNTLIEIDLRDVKSITDRILNPQSHDDNSQPLFKRELEEAIETIKKIKEDFNIS
jgi:hypothetical protein